MRIFTADTHFNHKAMAENRQFNSVAEHDEYRIKTWNNFVSKKDEVWHLGDFCFGDHKTVRQIRARLNGKIHLIMGNHDYQNRLQNISGVFSSVQDLKVIKIKRVATTLCHYAMRTWSASHCGSWQLYGHSHGNLPPIGGQWDVGLDNNGGMLLTEDMLEVIMRQIECSVNHLGVNAE